MQTPEQIIRHYIAGKDGNRPALFDQCFSEQAALQMESNTDAVSFPAKMLGREAIALNIASEFARTYENIFTFCIGAKPADHLLEFSCPWVVAMTVKDDHTGRLGWGQYQWHFDPDSEGLCCALTICIQEMLVVQPKDASQLVRATSALPYPWVQTTDLLTLTNLEIAQAEPLQQWLTNLNQT